MVLLAVLVRDCTRMCITEQTTPCHPSSQFLRFEHTCVAKLRSLLYSLVMGSFALLGCRCGIAPVRGLYSLSRYWYRSVCISLRTHVCVCCGSRESVVKLPAVVIVCLIVYTGSHFCEVGAAVCA